MKSFLLAPVLFVVGASQAFAHHNFTAEFDPDAPIQLQGTVTKVEFINPHAWIHIDVTEDDGTVTQWMIEGGTPNTLLRRGVTPTSLPVGAEIVVQGYQSRSRECNPACMANGRDVTFPDGRQLFVGSTGVGAPPGAQ